MSRQAAHSWIARYQQGGGLGSEADRSHPPYSAWTRLISPELEALICELRREYAVGVDDESSIP